MTAERLPKRPLDAAIECFVVGAYAEILSLRRALNEARGDFYRAMALALTIEAEARDYENELESLDPAEAAARRHLIEITLGDATRASGV